MREIRFRAWWQQNKQMVAIGMVTWKDGQIDRVMSECGGGFDYDELELMQYTGLKDKNGKEMYEGDILPLGKNRTLHLVKYDTERAGFIAKQLKAEYLIGAIPDTDFRPVHLASTTYFRSSVEGNIHENPELLKDIS